MFCIGAPMKNRSHSRRLPRHASRWRRMYDDSNEVSPERVLRREAQALLDAADRIDARAFSRAVSLVADCRGKVIASGAGTSGIVARKIAATLTSTGTAATFLHPSDALHGGLGLVSSSDVVV